MKEGEYAKTLAKFQVIAIFLMQDMGRNFLPKFIEICMESPCWCPSGWAPTWWPETSRNICHWVLLQKRELISRESEKHQNNTFFYYKNCSDSQIPRNKSWNKSLFNQLSHHAKCHITQKPRNSSIVYHKTKNPFGAKFCMNRSFQLLLYIATVKYQEDQQFRSLNFSDVIWKPAINRVTALMEFSFKKMHGSFAGLNKVAVITSWPYWQGDHKAGFHWSSKSWLATNKSWGCWGFTDACHVTGRLGKSEWE